MRPRTLSAVVLALALITGCSQPYDIVIERSQKKGNGTIGPGSTPDIVQEGMDTFNPRRAETASRSVSPKVRILFVVDNSGSTEPYQEALSRGFSRFGAKYLNADLDLSVAAITSDAYLAGSTSLDRYGGTSSACYSRLVPGVHDGRRPAIADSILSPFIDGSCNLKPSVAEEIRANGRRSLRPILSTVPPDGGRASQEYIDKLISDWSKNVLPGTDGGGEERGMQSVHQFLKDNEERPECQQSPASDPSCFFPRYNLSNSLVPPVYALVFVSDEHDQSNTNFGDASKPAVNMDRDVVKLMSDSTLIQEAQKLAAAAKARFDRFFLSLQETPSGDPNYSVFAITNIICNPQESPCGLRNTSSGPRRDENEEWGIEYSILVDAYTGNSTANGRPPQPADTKNSAAKHSIQYSITQPEYDVLFNYIGTKIVTDTRYVDVTVFQLSRDAKSVDQISATLVLGSGKSIAIPKEWLQLNGLRTLSISSKLLELIPDMDTSAKLEVRY